MIPYNDIDHDSGITAYECGDNYIIVRFKDGWSYEYTYQSAGIQQIEQMKLLASQNDSLNAYINKHVKKKYSRKF